MITNNTRFYPLSHGQQALWFLHQNDPENTAYNLFMTLRLSSELDIKSLQRTWQKIYDRHPILRTTYTTHQGQPVQQIHPNQAVKIPVIDATKWSEEELKAEILIEVDRPFDLEQGPIQRLILFTRTPTENIFVIAMHHIASDMWSYDVMLSEMLVLYENETEHTLPESLPYTDFVHWQSEMLSSSEGEKWWKYWQQKLNGKPTILNLPLDKPRPPVPTYNGISHTFKINEQLTTDLKSLAAKEGVTPFTILLSAFQVFLHRYSGQKEILIGVPLAGRTGKQFKQTVGYCANPVVLQADLINNYVFKELLIYNRRQLFTALKHQYYPFPLLVKNLEIPRDSSYFPLFQVSFTSQKHRWYEPDDKKLYLEKGKKLHIEPYFIGQRGAAFDLDLVLIETGETLELCWQYNTDLFTDATIQRMMANFQVLLAGIIANPEQHISQLPILTDVEQNQILKEWNQTQRDYPQDKCIHHLFEEQVKQNPDAVALIYEDEKLTYQELNKKANQLSHYLQHLGVKPETLVGICVERSLELIISILAVLKAGGAYVPLDPAYPQERLNFILQDAQLPIILTQQHFITKLLPTSAKIICTDIDIHSQPSDNPSSSVKSDNLAYVIYTSGSTGKPKGVMVAHRGLCNLATAQIKLFEVRPDSSVLQFASISFDASISEIVMAICAGAKLCLATRDSLQPGQPLQKLLQIQNISHVTLVPSALAALSPQDLPNLKNLIVAGEPCPGDLAASWAVGRQFFNAYGPTEATVCATVLLYQPGMKISIGQAIAHTQIYILDHYLQPVPIGVPGELHIAGVGLARGYLNQPDLTAQKFIPNPFSNDTNSRLYKTGDLGRYLPDGNIEFLGRIDNQVKIRGFRIELEEIETTIVQHPQIQQAIAIVREDIPGTKRLVAYIVPHQQHSLNSNEIWEYLKHKLPEYMIPAIFVFLDSLPLTPNGKIDRKSLPIPSTVHQSDNFTAPRNPIETALVEIWQQVLRVEKIGIHDNFFALGGDSIISIQIIDQSHQQGIQITSKQLFQYQTIAQLANIVTINKTISPLQSLVTGEIPLTPSQHWFFEQNSPQPHYFNQTMMLEVSADTQPALLEQAIKTLLIHHDALRMRFIKHESGWQQINSDQYEPVPFQVFDFSALPATEQTQSIETIAQELQSSLNLTTGPVIRVALFQLGTEKNGRLLLICQHLVTDAISLKILLADLVTAYKQLQREETIQLPPKTTSFKDWAIRQQKYGQSQTLEQELKHWLAQYSADISPLPLDYPLKPGLNLEGSTQAVGVSLTPAETHNLLQAVPQAYSTTTEEILLTALVQTITSWTGSHSLFIDLEGHRQPELFANVDLSRTVGWFTIIYPALLQLNNTDDCGVAIKTIKEQIRQIPHHGIGFSNLRYYSQNPDIRQKLQSLPKPQISFYHWGTFEQIQAESILLGLAPENVGYMFSPQAERSYLLNVVSAVVENQLQISWLYSGDIHQQRTIESLAHNYITYLRKLIQHCQSPEAGGYTPADFPDADLSQDELDNLLSELE
ncbi:non-ribosomal peptide synthetase [Nodularia spumigena]|uniref:Linear gramicidin synthase subunit B n=1 Tax=Nodularia spumigena UHCC 0039 TaxID=1914872 RepID=A0A2S0Q4D2_NODSP|nr:non-ribosomal peptide synthetase [Nodularia spumigena]AVZ31266.1 linear gramicidin synthase subunit B [Nodularia spumigena UHCC 0039]